MRKFLIPLICFFFAIHQIDAVAQSYSAGACSPIPGSQTCADATPCKLDSSGMSICLSGVTLPSGALSVPQTCWQYTYQYACSGGGTDSCTSYENNSACSVSASTCSSTVPETGNCAQWLYTYSCQTAAAQTTKQTVCSSSSNLFNTALTPTPSVTNGNAVKVAVANAIAQQTQVYGQGVNTIFNGVSENCHKGYFGLQNCCSSTPSAAQSNSAVLGTVIGNAANVVKFAGSSAIDAASPYVFDAMYSAGGYAAGLAQSAQSVSAVTFDLAQSGQQLGQVISTGTSLSASGLNLGAYGFTYNSAGNALASQGAGGISGFLADTSIDIGESLGAGSGVLVFNPYVFAASVAAQFAVQAIEQMMACTQEEQLLGIHRGANLSVYVNEVCTNKIPIIGTCLQWQDNYCSFNSILAKIINLQGKAQLGLDFTNCSGLSIAQIQQLNFSNMNFSEFTNSMVAQAQANLPNPVATATAVSTNVQSGGTKQSTITGTAYPKQ